ncbi:1448_t:CDS:2, partial [Gigaspora rosea]
KRQYKYRKRNDYKEKRFDTDLNDKVQHVRFFGYMDKGVRKYLKGNRRIVESRFDGRLDKCHDRLMERNGESVNKGNENGKNDSMDVMCKMDFYKEEIEKDERKNVKVNDDRCGDLPELNDNGSIKAIFDEFKWNLKCTKVGDIDNVNTEVRYNNYE